MNTPTQMRGGVQTTTIATSMNGRGTRPIDISEQTMPMLSLRLYAATPPLEVDVAIPKSSAMSRNEDNDDVDRVAG